MLPLHDAGKHWQKGIRERGVCVCVAYIAGGFSTSSLLLLLLSYDYHHDDDYYSFQPLGFSYKHIIKIILLHTCMHSYIHIWAPGFSGLRHYTYTTTNNNLFIIIYLFCFKTFLTTNVPLCVTQGGFKTFIVAPT